MLRHLFLLSLFVSFCGRATVILDTLYINSGTVTVMTKTFQAAAFNETPVFFKQNKIFEVSSGNDLLLHVINNDLVEHTFTVDGMIETGNVIPAGGSGDFFMGFPTNGLYRFYSDRPGGELLGASSMALVGYTNYSCYYYNFFDLNDTLTDDIDAGSVTSIPSDYMPDVFVMNMNVLDDLMLDSLSFIQQTVGDTIILAIINSGNMDHNLHFHGYHLEVLQADQYGHMVGWSKDSFPVVKGEVLVLRLVPDQPGLYMVHNHNMITITNDGIYPGGMMTQIMITP